MSVHEAEAQRLGRIESFYDGLDKVDGKLDPTTRDQFQQMVGTTDNPQEARAAAINKAYLAYTQPQARDAIETQWPWVRQQVAQSLGVNKPDISDTELYGMLGNQVKQAQNTREVAHTLAQQIQLSVLEGGDWMKTYSDFMAKNKPDGVSADHFLPLAQSAADSVKEKALTIGPAVKAVADFFTQAKSQPIGFSVDQFAPFEGVIRAVKDMDPEDRTMAINLAAQKVARETKPVERQGFGGLEAGGESLHRGFENMAVGLSNQADILTARLLTGPSDKEGSAVPDMRNRAQTLREVLNAYNAVTDPVKGKTLVTQGLLNLSNMLPQVGMMYNPLVGVPIIFATAQDQRRSELQQAGVPVGKADAVATVQAGVDTALQFVTSNMVFGKIAPGGGGLLSTAKSGADVMKRMAGYAATEGLTLGAVTAAQQFSPLIIREAAAQLSDKVPGVDWESELGAMKHAMPETIATLLPMVMLGTGTATFRDLTKYRGYMSDVNTLKAVGFTEEEASKIAQLPNPVDQLKAIHDRWSDRATGGEEQADAIATMDDQVQAKAADKNASITKNDDGTFKVQNADGSIALDGINDPNIAQSAADAIADKQANPGKALEDLAAALSGVAAPKPVLAGERMLDQGKEAGFVGADSNAVQAGARMLTGFWTGVKQRVTDIGHEIASDPKFTPFKEALNRWVGSGQLTSLLVRHAVAELKRTVPDEVSREGITAWLQAGGDSATLKYWAENSKVSIYKRGYEAALKLTPDQIKVAEGLRDFYRKQLVTLQAHGIVNEGVEHYVNQMWIRELPNGEKAPNQQGRLTTQLKNAKEKVFGSYFEGEQAGFTPVTKDISKLMAIYADSVSKVLSTRKLISDLTTKVGSDGRPLAAPLGIGSLTDGKEGDPSFIKPLAKDQDTFDYKTLNNPALAKWKWVGEHEGAPVMLEGQLGLHPEVFDHMKAALGRSIIREWYDRPAGPLSTLLKDSVHGIDKIGQVTKGTMLGFFSPFHQVQEGTHAIGHKINPFSNMPALDPTNPQLQRAVNHGLMLAGDNEAMAHFEDAVNDPNPLNTIPVVGELAKNYQTWLFHEWIPQLKLKTWNAIVERNTARYADDLKANRVTQDDVDYLSSQQTNAAYGHLNYADLGRDPTLQHIARILLLAPDFLEARARFTGQAIKGVANKAGREQLVALFTLAATQYVTSRILNKTLDDDWHNDRPFSVVVGNREYTMRSVPEDMYKLFHDPRQFTMGRISPLIGKGIFELGTGKNWRGERVSFTDTFADMATAWIPITLRSAPGIRELTNTDRANPISPYEQLLGSLGLHISRHSAMFKAYQLADAWKKSQGIKEDTGVYPVSKFQQLRYALEDGDAEKAQEAIDKLKAAHTKNLGQSFHQSLFNPFTGSHASDAKFKTSLSEDDRALVEHAEAMRQAIWMRYNLLLQQKPTSGTNN